MYNEKNMMNYCFRRMEAIQEEMQDLEQTETMRLYLKLQKSEEVREYRKLEAEKEFLNTIVDTYRMNMMKSDESKGRTL